MRLMIIGKLDGQIVEASKIAKKRGAKVMHLDNSALAFECLCNGQGADLLMVSVEEDIDKLNQMLASEHISIPIVACGVNAAPQAAAKAIKDGAQEYIPLPPDEELIAAVLEAITEENCSVIHCSDAMKQVLTMADRIAQSKASVLITGESGTGKEVIARYIHSKSDRADKSFISVNCAAIPENLLESELFGHEKGAFTGALNRRIGKFEEASGGTLLLDEISEMDIKLQAKLLRALQEQEIDRVGGTKPIKVDIRILATSNRNLISEVQKGNFREDLYFRLNVININLPPLRERKGDIELLGKFFIEKYSKANGLPPRELTDEAKEKMEQYRWPGNVRELENTMHRAVLMAQGNQIDAGAIMLPEFTTAPATSQGTLIQPSGVVYNNSNSEPDNSKLYPENDANTAKDNDLSDKIEPMVGQTVADVEKQLILKTLDHCLGNRTKAANILGISIRTLRNKLNTYTN